MNKESSSEQTFLSTIQNRGFLYTNNVKNEKSFDVDMTKKAALFEELAERWPIAPGESSALFIQRMRAVQNLYGNPPQRADLSIEKKTWEEVIEQTESLFGISPKEVVVFYSNENLLFFQGAATWLEKKDEGWLPMIQLPLRKRRCSFAKEQEVLRHEAIHAARMGFDEPIFEEFFAYESSSSKWRRFFGPLFLSQKEAILWMIFWCLPLVCEGGTWIWGESFLFSIARLTPGVFSLFLLGRLVYLKYILHKALSGLKELVAFSSNPWAVLVRLRDREIFLFAKLSKEKSALWIASQEEFRWQMIRKKYF